MYTSTRMEQNARSHTHCILIVAHVILEVYGLLIVYCIDICISNDNSDMYDMKRQIHTHGHTHTHTHTHAHMYLFIFFICLFPCVTLAPVGCWLLVLASDLLWCKDELPSLRSPTTATLASKRTQFPLASDLLWFRSCVDIFS